MKQIKNREIPKVLLYNVYATDTFVLTRERVSLIFEMIKLEIYI
jgi:hypothetical protein